MPLQVLYRLRDLFDEQCASVRSFPVVRDGRRHELRGNAKSALFGINRVALSMRLPTLLAAIAAGPRASDQPDTTPCPTCRNESNPRHAASAALNALAVILDELVGIGPPSSNNSAHAARWLPLFEPIVLQLTQRALTGDAWRTLPAVWLEMYARTITSLSCGRTGGNKNRYTRLCEDCSVVNLLCCVWSTRGQERPSPTCDPICLCASLIPSLVYTRSRARSVWQPRPCTVGVLTVTGSVSGACC